MAEGTPDYETEVRRRVKAMRDDELVQFTRETITRLEALADRLEIFARSESVGRDARDA